MKTPAFLIVLFANIVLADNAVVIEGLQGLGDTRYHHVQSKSLGRPFHVFVGLPVDYDPSRAEKYPTVYILDGGELYPMLRAYYNYLRNGEEVPDLIIVGISYGSRDFAGGNQRGHDYTAPSDEREHFGGAQDFQAFLAGELLPMIESRYASDPQRRLIFGQSLGGQFVLFSAQTKPDLFRGHIASNPALHRNLPLFLSMTPDAPATLSKLYVSSGSNDEPEFRQPALAWIEHWESEESKPWQLKTETLEGHGHFSTPPIAFRRGLRWSFAD